MTTKIGEKASTLIKLKSCGINVPNFFVVSNEEFQEKDDRVYVSIVNKARELNTDYFAVRSSSNLEDTSKASCAGMFHTELNVTIDTLFDAIRKVRNYSLNLEAFNQSTYVGKNTSVEMSVIVQEQIKSDISGICISKPDFSINKIYIESCLGLCHAITDGLIIPSFCYVDRYSMTIVENCESNQEVIATCDDHGGIKIINNNEDDIKPFMLSEEIAVEISKKALLIEEVLGIDSIDMEWTYKEGQLYVLQARTYVQF